MYYAIIAEDMPNSLEKRKRLRGQHLERLANLKTEGRLLLAGPHPVLDSTEAGESGFSGSLIVAEFPDLASAQTFANQDPYRLGGVYRQVTVKPFIKALP